MHRRSLLLLGEQEAHPARRRNLAVEAVAGLQQGARTAAGHFRADRLQALLGERRQQLAQQRLARLKPAVHRRSSQAELARDRLDVDALRRDEALGGERKRGLAGRCGWPAGTAGNGLRHGLRLDVRPIPAHHRARPVAASLATTTYRPGALAGL